MTPAEKEHESNNNRLFLIFVAVCAVVLALIYFTRDPVDSVESQAREKAREACYERGMAREFARDGTFDDDEIERVVTTCYNAYNRPRS